MRTIRHFIDDRAENEPNKIYMIAPEPKLELTYGQLKANSVALGKHLMGMGLKKGDKVSFMMGNGYQTNKLFLGSMYSGFVIAPLNLLAQPSQLEYVIDHSDTKIIFFTEDQKEKLETALGNVTRDIKLIQINNDAETIFPGDEEISDFDLPDVTEDDDALLLYTSGTTASQRV